MIPVNDAGQASRTFLMMLAAPGLRGDLDRHTEQVAQCTGMGPIDVRHRLAKPGVTLLRVGDGGQSLAGTARALTSAGYPALAVSEARLLSVAAPQRAVGVVKNGDGLALVDRHGRSLVEIDSGKKLLLVVGDLNEKLGAARPGGGLSSAARRMLATGQGNPVLRVFDASGAGAVVFGQRFNYTTLGEAAGVSASQNFRRLLAQIQQYCGEHHLDLDLGLADVPPLNLSLAGEAHSLERLEIHARTSLALWLDGLLAATTTVPEQEITPAVAEEPGIKPLSQAEMDLLADRSRYPGWMGNWMRRSALLGPPGLVISLLVLSALFVVAAGLFVPALVYLTGLPLGLLGLVASHSSWSRKRLIEDFPTSRVRSMAMGKVELVGRAVARLPLKTPFSQVDCVYYQAEMHRLQQTSKGGRKWVRINSLCSGELPFYLQDDTGSVLVDPVGATFDIQNRKTFNRLPLNVGNAPILGRGYNDVRYVEAYIGVGSPVFVLGTARPLRQENDGRTELRQRLQQLKRDQERMAAFDLDGDGRIDPHEWDLAVQAVEDELLHDRLRESSDEQEALVGRGEPGSLFVVSDHDEDSLIRVLTWRQWGAGLFALMLLAVAVWGTLQFVAQ